MKKLYEKKPVLFAVIWIVIYVVLFGSAGNQSEQQAQNYAVQIGIGLVMTAVLVLFLRKYDLAKLHGFCKFQGEPRKYLYFIPLLIAGTANIWTGFGWKHETAAENLTGIAAIGIIAPFLEELILRSLLFHAIAKTSIKRGYWFAALSFGIGHFSNLAYGAPLKETVVQVIFACCFGICAGALLTCGKSLLPGVLLHMAWNTLNFVGAAQTSDSVDLLCIAAASILFAGYGLYLLHVHHPFDAENAAKK